MKKGTILVLSLVLTFFIQAVVVFGVGAADITIEGTTTDSSAASLDVTNSAGTSLLCIRNDGKVGIGTTTPSEALEVEK